MATPTHESFAAAKRVLAWLNTRQELGVTWGDASLRSLVDLQPPDHDIMPMARETDYSFHCYVDSDLPGGPLPPKEPPAAEDEPTSTGDPGSHRAQLGFIMMLAGGCFASASRRQHSTAVDTAAAEMFAASSAAAEIMHLTGVLAFLSFGVLGTQRVRVWCDNEAAVLAANDASSIKRLAYIARRVRFIQELVTRGILRLLDVSGKENPADVLTKHVAPKNTFLEYMARVYNAPLEMLRATTRA